MEGVEKIRTACRGCHGGCGIIAYRKDGKVIKVEGDPKSPISHGSACSKGLAILQHTYHPDRVVYPMKRTARGWERISWDTALNTVADKFNQIIKDFGSEAITVGMGTARDYEAFLIRFTNLLGTPNFLTPGNQCYIPKLSVSIIICGQLPVCDYEQNPDCIVVWASNPLWTNPDEYKGVNFWRAYKNASKRIVIDPRRGFLARKADLWLQLRPGTDAALAFGFLKVIAEEGLCDDGFVRKYVHGWDALLERVKEYPLERVEEITWVKKELIREAARTYATTKPACIHWGVPLEQTINSIDSSRLLIALMAVTGNLDVPGGNVFFPPPPVTPFPEFIRHEALLPEQAQKAVGRNRYKLASVLGMAPITPKHLWDTVLKGDPYPIKAAFLVGTNPVITQANAKEVYKALKKLEFTVVVDFFLTPTAELAHIFLPAATWLEHNNVGSYGMMSGYVVARQKVVEVEECWADHKIIQELGKKLGQENYWGETVEDTLNLILKPSGLSWEQFTEKGYLRGEMAYRKYEENAFGTPTGKVELYSTIMEEWGYDPLPTYKEVPESPVSRPDLLERYPYILNAGLRTPTFFHSEHRMIPWLREIRPDPLVEIHPETAEKYGIRDRQWVYLETPRGRIRQRAKLNEGINPMVIMAEHGWWFPEVKDPGHGWDIANVNVLTDDDPSGYNPAMGTTNLRTLLCNISPCENE